MDKIDIIELRKMSYNELRAYAKKFNIKGNGKASKLIDAILEKANQQSSDNNSSLISEDDDLMNGGTPKTPAPVSKARRRTYELTPETTLVLDIATAENVAKPSPANVPVATARIPDAANPLKPEKENVRNTRSKIPVKEKQTRPRICATPNFRKIHEKAFSKMDSLDVYVAKKVARLESHRDLQRSVKSVRSLGLKFAKQAPTVADTNIFKPSVLTTAALQLNFASSTKTRPAKTDLAKSKISAVSIKTPFRFVGKSAVKNSRTPLPTKPPGPSIKATVKPTFRYQRPKLEEKDSVNVAQNGSKKVRENTRSMLKGVRLNKRFELQLQARGVVLK